MTEIVKGTPADLEEIIDFVTLAFHLEPGIEALAPKTYREGADCEKYHYLIKENGRIRAALCALPITFSVSGAELNTLGIGAVSVHRADRGKGYMQMLVNRALHDARAEGWADFSMLGGRRQRYGYFGYESGGIQMNASLIADNVRHALSGEDVSAIELREILPQDEALIARAAELYQTEPIRALRKPEWFYDICRSWVSRVYAVLEHGRMIGYFVLKNDSMTEFVLEDYDRMNAVMCTVLKTVSPNGIQFMDSVTVPGRMRFYENICEGYSLGYNKRYLFFRYENTIRAFLELKAKLQKLPEGEVFLEIEGYGKLRIALQNGKAECEKTGLSCPIVLPANKAASYLFSPIRSCYTFDTEQDLLANAWFPLPLYLPRQDVN